MRYDIRRAGLVLSVTGTVVLAACADRTLISRSVPGTLTVSLDVSAGAHPGGVTLTLGGTELGVPESADGRYQIFVEGLSPSSATIAVIGQQVGGPLVQVDVPDVTDLSAYSAQIIEIVDDRNALLTDHTGYRLVLTAEPTQNDAGSPGQRRNRF